MLGMIKRLIALSSALAVKLKAVALFLRWLVRHSFLLTERCDEVRAGEYMVLRTQIEAAVSSVIGLQDAILELMRGCTLTSKTASVRLT